MDYSTVIGIVGAGIILIGFVLNQTGKLTAESSMYDSINVVGALFLIVYAFMLSSVPFIVLNTVWLLVSGYGLIKKTPSAE